MCQNPVASPDARGQVEASKTVPLEVRLDVKHTRRGILSMARSDDPHSGGSSFSILLGAAPHLDMNYAIFGCARPGHAGPGTRVRGRARVSRKQARTRARVRGCARVLGTRVFGVLKQASRCARAQGS
jgi:cyclophilin family peptidyl-prolyl cis-trans isomerase